MMKSTMKVLALIALFTASATANAASTTIAVGCNWMPIFNPATDNYAFPDTSATYWIAAGPSNPTSDMEIRIEGEYPYARYSSFHVYDGSGQTGDNGLAHAADFAIAPEKAGLNPFLSQTERSRVNAGASYTEYVNFGNAPSVLAANTLYRGLPASTDSATKKRTYIMYRVYLPNNASDPTGSVGLPKLILHSKSGDIPLAQSPDQANCQSMLASDLSAIALEQALGTPPTSPGATNPPQFRRWGGVAGGLLGDGLYVNKDSAYVYSLTSAFLGQIYLVRGKAPSYTDQPKAPLSPDVRYWSICQNDYKTQSVVGCIADKNAHLDADGYYNIVVATTANKPVSMPGFDYLNFGTKTLDTAAIIYRNMLVNPSFADAVQNVPTKTDPKTVIGDYAPEATYCSLKTFNANVGKTPAEIFAACANELQNKL